MNIHLDRAREETLLEQARVQIISGLHGGLLRPGDRLPSLRRVAALSGLNVKTVMRVYAGLEMEGLVVVRSGSGAFVTAYHSDAFEPAGAVGVWRLLRRHLDQAAGMNLTSAAYASLAQRFVDRSSVKHRSVTVLECNEEQVRLYAREISLRIGVKTQPVLLQDLKRQAGAALVRSCSILAVTDFHLKEGMEIARKLGKPLASLRLRPDFLPRLMEAARRGRFAMIVSNTSFFPAFRRTLGLLGLQRVHLDHISVAAGNDSSAVKRAAGRAEIVYLSPLCDRAVRALIPRGVRILSFPRQIAGESMEELEAWILLSGLDGSGGASAGGLLRSTTG